MSKAKDKARLAVFDNLIDEMVDGLEEDGFCPAKNFYMSIEAVSSDTDFEGQQCAIYTECSSSMDKFRKIIRNRALSRCSRKRK